MNPEQVGAGVLRWVRWYTRDLPAAVADRRLQEIRADIHDHIEHQRRSGVGDSQVVRELASRLIRGLAADMSWRRVQVRILVKQEEAMWVRRILGQPTSRVLLGVAALLAFPAIATAAGNANWSRGDFILAGLLLALIGTTLELAVRSAGNVVGASAIAALGVTAAFAGEANDAPGLTLIGLLLVASAGLLVFRTLGRAR